MASLQLPSMTNLKRQVVGGIDLAICCVLVNFPSSSPSSPYSCTNVENGRAAATFAPKRTPQLSLISLGVFLKSVVNTHLL